MMMHHKQHVQRQHRRKLTPAMVESFLLLVALLLNSNVGQTKPVSAFLPSDNIRKTTTTITTNTASNRDAAISQQQFTAVKHSKNFNSRACFTSLLLPPPPTGTMKLNNGDKEHDVDMTATTTSIHPVNMHVLIEYCTGCKWNLRAQWMAQELLFHYHNNQVPVTVGVAVTVVPSSVAGTFRITTIGSSPVDSIRTVTTTSVPLPPWQPTLLWDRTIDSGFPEMDELFDRINEYNKTIAATDDGGVSSEGITDINATIIPRPYISIRYGNPNDIFRASYIGQEILSTFHDEVKAVSLIPTLTTRSTLAPFSEWTVWLNDSVLIYNYHRNRTGGDENADRQSRFMPIKELKQLIRDQINPTKDLGHSDVIGSKPKGVNNNNDDENESRTTLDDEDDDDDDTASEMARNYFGVA